MDVDDGVRDPIENLEILAETATPKSYVQSLPIKKFGASVGRSDSLEKYMLIPPWNPRLVVAISDYARFRAGLLAYKPGSASSRALLKVMSLFGPRFLRGPVITVSPKVGLISVIRNMLGADFKLSALFLGSPGVTNTATCKFTAVNASLYVKVATTEVARSFVKNEYRVLSELSDSFIDGIDTPLPLKLEETDRHTMLFTEDCGGDGTRQFAADDPRIKEIAMGIFSKSIKMCRFGASAYALALRYKAESVKDQRIIEMVSYVEEKLGSRILPFGLLHGDFTPWNILRDGKRVVVLDWEWSQPSAPPLLDLFHFLFQSNVHYLKGALGDIVEHPLVRESLAALKIDHSLGKDLYAAYLVHWIVKEVAESKKSFSSLADHVAVLEVLRSDK